MRYADETKHVTEAGSDILKPEDAHAFNDICSELRDKRRKSRLEHVPLRWACRFIMANYPRSLPRFSSAQPPSVAREIILVGRIGESIASRQGSCEAN